ncbi:MAG: protein-methionine-sulfoxide reductase catalytic subunit MsrP [Rhodothermales bacterium]
MSNIIIRPNWVLPESAASTQDAYFNRRRFISTLGLGTIGVASVGSLGCIGQTGEAAEAPKGPLDTIPADAPRDGYPAARNSLYKVPERPITDRIAASSYNNFYEFDGNSKEIWHLTDKYDPYPFTIEIGGLVEKPMTLDLSDLIRRFGIEERLYRHRCVEAWSLTVPWEGFPLRKLVELAKPLSKASHLKFVSIARKNEMPGIKKQSWYKWPYYEGLRMDEATNELAFAVTGMYGEPLTKQNGSPIRLALPWKYGYKGPKAFAKIEFVDYEPKTFWNDIAPDEYSFLSNVNPKVPHPRWSQATERFIKDMDTTQRVRTQLFNGYEEFVGDMYPNEPR